eukprot:CAMPEP_0182427844 /NCGR_PEP_ID=MMETSP1167-20130531/20210_1 /TAXON_ID=2988 /ORGANISM="Mallomonas Sp, Strain CCMP3275" /LENGTH=143 /DNA_ID=CAMNT_0024610383 /DNA_START=164 /DNA_END=595 /DNA_ORIENTATION=-
MKLLEKFKGDPKEEKKRLKVKRELRIDTAKLQAYRMGSVVILAVVMLVVYQALRTYYDGVIIAKLPFTPFNPVTRLTHAGIQSDDLTDCGMTFIYTLCSMAFRPNIQKLFGDAFPKGTAPPGFFEQMAEMEQRLSDNDGGKEK